MPGRRRTARERAVCSSFFAWALACLGLGAVWIWLTRRLCAAQGKPVVQRELIANDELEMPALTLCQSPAYSLPTFYDFPKSGFRGSPWLTVWLDQDSSGGNVVGYPDTKGLILDTVVTTGDVEACERETAALDPMVLVSRESIRKGKSVGTQCQRCITVGREKRVVTKRLSSHGEEQPDGIRMEIVASRVPRLCFYPRGSRDTHRTLLNMMDEIHRSLDDLIARGVLILSDADPEEVVEGAPEFLKLRKMFSVPIRGPQAPPPPPDLDILESFACGVYLFSGLWYPTTVKKVSWTYNKTGTGWWERNNGPGFGPYFTKSLLFENETLSSRDEAPPREPRVHPVFYPPIPTFDLFVTDVDAPLEANLSSSYQVALLRTGTRIPLRLYKELDIDGKVIYGARSWPSLSLESLNPITRLATPSAFFRAQVDVAFGSFLMQKIVTRKAYELSAYVADLANFFDIFIGQSVFALLVAALTAAVIGRHSELVEISPSRPK